MTSHLSALLSLIALFMVATCPIASAQSSTTSIAAARKLAINAPLPKYPYGLATRGIGGRGVVEVSVDPKTGAVTSARMLQSTGNDMLDQSALKAFRQWHFKPGTIPKVKIPIEFNPPTPDHPQI
jgi:TonB family protein